MRATLMYTGFMVKVLLLLRGYKINTGKGCSTDPFMGMGSMVKVGYYCYGDT